MSKRLKRVVKLLISCIFYVVSELPAMVARKVGWGCGGRCIILYYHSIKNQQRKAFTRQMDWFRSLVTPISETNFLPSNAKGLYGMITFDDGYESIVNNALPQLCARGLPCTIFIPTGSLGTRPQWVRDSSNRFYSERVVDRGQIAQLSSEKLVAIGSHGVSHANSCSLSDQEFKFEVMESKKVLEEITNNPVTSFSFPHGKYTSRHLDILKAAGYERAFSIDPSVERPGNDKFLFGRVSVGPDDWRIEFSLKVLGAYRWQNWISRRKNNCSRPRLCSCQITI